MTAQHTRGPWKINPAESSQVKLIDSTDGAVGEMIDCRNPADARLIAAAPDLLAALEALLDAPTDVHSVIGAAKLRMAWETARVAIAKARGYVNRCDGFGSAGV